MLLCKLTCLFSYSGRTVHTVRLLSYLTVYIVSSHFSFISCFLFPFYLFLSHTPLPHPAPFPYPPLAQVTMDFINIYSLNAKGLNIPEKRCMLLNDLKRAHTDVAFIQDTLQDRQSCLSKKLTFPTCVPCHQCGGQI